MATMPEIVNEAYTSVRGAVIGTLSQGGPSKALPKHKPEDVYFETYLLNTQEGGGHELSQATRLKRVYPAKATGKRKASQEGGAGIGEAAAGGGGAGDGPGGGTAGRRPHRTQS
jgi:hypothetical protein